jgi:hypothetical protein
MDFSFFYPHWILPLSLLALLPFSAFAATGETKGESTSLQQSADASKQWLELVDKGRYGESWDKASFLMKSTIQKASWEKLMEQTRKPLGSVKSRQVLDQRTAKNPPGMPKGDYIVMFYKTAFSRKDTAYELLTLYYQEGKWNVVTYQIDQGDLKTTK